MKFIDDFKEKMKPQNAKMRVCMMGARGVGKTSVLTSMFYNLNSVNSTTNLQLTAVKGTDDHEESPTIALLSERHDQLMQMFSKNSADISEVSKAGIDASFEVNSFYFQFGEKGKPTRIDLEIKDFPGEYINSSPDDVQKFINESNAIIIAVDTPHMMECDGAYNDAKNEVSIITSFFKECFNELTDDKLVLFVPLKCEKYFNNNTIDNVRDRLMDSYSELIDFFRENKRKESIACAITPILTVGEVVFDDFERDEHGNVVTLKNVAIPIKTKYKYSKPGAQYAPKFCEQPLSYLLSFILKLYERSKQASNKKTWLEKLGEILKLFPDDPGLLMECHKFSSKKITNKYGYKIIQNEAKL